MNRKKKLLRVIAVVICLVLIMGANVGISAAETENIPVVTNGKGLLQAIERAHHGDTIGIRGLIAFYDSTVIGDEGKQITLLRMDENSYLSFSGTGESTIQNITFDGNGIESMYPMIYTVRGLTLKNDIFQNCVCSNGEGGAIALYNENDATFNNLYNCTFKNNEAVRGGHIILSGSVSATFENCVFENGTATNEGGAIFFNTGTVYEVKNSVITQNKAGTYGGGIYNAGRGVLSGTKLYYNTAEIIGGDYATENGLLNFAESVAEWEKLYEPDQLKPIRWRYESDSGITGETLILEYLGEQPEPEIPDETEPTEPEESEPTEPTESEEQPMETEEPDESQPEQPTEEEPGTEPEAPDDEEPTTPATPSEPSVNNNSTTTTTTTNSSSSTDNSDRSTHNTTTDNSRREEINDSNNTSTVNNYYAQEQQPSSGGESVQTIVVPAGSSGSGEPIEQTIRVEAPDGSTGEDGMTLNVNVNVGEDGTPDQEVEASPQQQDGASWYQVAVLCLLSAIFGLRDKEALIWAYITSVHIRR